MQDTINIGGKDRPIKFGYGAIYSFEKKTGKGIIAVFEAMGNGNFMLSDLIDLTYAGLVMGAKANKQKFEADVLEVADWLSEADAQIIEQITQCLADSLPKQKDGEAADEKPGQPGE